jgi:hypothetical protein
VSLKTAMLALVVALPSVRVAFGWLLAGARVSPSVTVAVLVTVAEAVPGASSLTVTLTLNDPSSA